MDRIAEAIKLIDDVNIDVDQRWTLAIGFSNLVCSMIHVADGMYGKQARLTSISILKIATAVADKKNKFSTIGFDEGRDNDKHRDKSFLAPSKSSDR